MTVIVCERERVLKSGLPIAAANKGTALVTLCKVVMQKLSTQSIGWIVLGHRQSAAHCAKKRPTLILPAFKRTLQGERQGGQLVNGIRAT